MNLSALVLALDHFFPLKRELRSPFLQNHQMEVGTSSQVVADLPVDRHLCVWKHLVVWQHWVLN